MLFYFIYTSIHTHTRKTRTQALRIAVNDEMGALESVLLNAARLVRPGGRIVVLSYHSLEDKRVKVYS
jgi:16S rRNA C1402 N4-methylase RsmH